MGRMLNNLTNALMESEADRLARQNRWFSIQSFNSALRTKVLICLAWVGLHQKRGELGVMVLVQDCVCRWAPSEENGKQTSPSGRSERKEEKLPCTLQRVRHRKGRNGWS